MSATEIDRFEIQTRPGGGSSYAVTLRHEVVVGGETQFVLQGPLTPETAAALGWTLDVVLGAVQAAAIRDAEIARAATIRIEREAQELAELAASGQKACAELMAEVNAGRAEIARLTALLAPPA